MNFRITSKKKKFCPFSWSALDSGMVKFYLVQIQKFSSLYFFFFFSFFFSFLSFFLSFFLRTLTMYQNERTALQQLPAWPPPGLWLENCAWKTSTQILATVYWLFPLKDLTGFYYPNRSNGSENPHLYDADEWEMRSKCETKNFR